MTLADAAALAAAHAEHGERERGLAPEVVDALRAGDLFRLCVPKALGGAEAPPLALVEAVETLAQADASAGWCLAVTATSGLVSAYLDEEAAREVYGTAGVAVGGVFAPRGRAVAVAGELEVSGRWSFASGSTFCDWLMGGCVTEREGEDPGAPSRPVPARRGGDRGHLDRVGPTRHRQPRHRRGRTARAAGPLGCGDRRLAPDRGGAVRLPALRAARGGHRGRDAGDRPRRDGRPARARGREDARRAAAAGWPSAPPCSRRSRAPRRRCEPPADCS